MPGDGCDAECKFENCGDAVTDGYEDCDDGNTDEDDDCVGCKNAACGDGFTHKDDE